MADFSGIIVCQFSKSSDAIMMLYAEKKQKRSDVLEHYRPDKKFHPTFVAVNPDRT